HVAVVGQHAGRGNVEGRLFAGGVAVVDCHRRVVGACDRDADGGDARVSLAVVGLVGKVVGAVVVGRRAVAEAAVAVQGEAAVRGLADQHRVQGVPVHVAVVGEHAGRRDVQSGVLGRGVTVVASHRRVVYSADLDGDRGYPPLGSSVVGLVGKVVGAVVASRRRVAKAAVAIQGQAAVRWLSHQDRAQGVAVKVGVVGQHAGRAHV